MRTKKRVFTTIFALTLLSPVASDLSAQDEPQKIYSGDYGMGPGMMRGWDADPHQRWGDWDGWHGRGMMGPGMMYGPGPMMGPGMMYGPGSMMGPGMMYGYGPGSALNLNESQQKKIDEIQEDLRKKHWDLMGKMNDEYAKLGKLYSAEKRDPDAIDKQLQQIFNLRRQMMMEAVRAQNRMEEQLTDEQKQQLRSYGSGWR